MTNRNPTPGVDLGPIKDALTALYYGRAGMGRLHIISTGTEAQNAAITVIVNAAPDLVAEVERLRAALGEACDLATSLAEDSREYGTPPTEAIERLRAVGGGAP